MEGESELLSSVSSPPQAQAEVERIKVRRAEDRALNNLTRASRHLSRKMRYFYPPLFET
jgi:hypothetical protein